MADAQAIINYLATRIAQLETDKAVLLSDLTASNDLDALRRAQEHPEWDEEDLRTKPHMSEYDANATDTTEEIEWVTDETSLEWEDTDE